MKKTIKLLAVILSVCILLCSLPMTAFAFDGNMPEVESVVIEDVRITKGNNGWLQSYTDSDGNVLDYWMRYSYNPSEITISLKDGTVLYPEWGTTFYYNDNYYWLDYTDPQSYDNQWDVGEHTVNCSIMGFDTSFKVVIESNHVTDIKVHDVTVYDGLDSYTETDWTEEGNIEYKAYRLNNIKFDIEFDDGYKETNTTWCYYNDCSFNAQIVNNMQSANNEWQVGNTYQVSVAVGGIISKVNVTVAPNPVKSLEFEDTSVIFGSADYGRYDYYTNAKLTFNDGTVIEKATRSSFEFAGRWYSFTFSDTQDETPWVEGGTYEVTATVMGVSGNFKVTILPSPIEKIEIPDTYVVEGFGGYECPGYPESYYMYSFSVPENGKVTFKDGTTQELQGSSLYYQNEWYYISQIDNQETEHWQVGNTYKVTATLLGCSTEFNVEVRELPYTYLEVDDIVIAESAKNGSRYSYTPIFKFTQKDGSIYTISGQYTSVKVYDRTFSGVSVSGDNQYSEPWTVGNTYTLTARFGKLSADFNVTIAPENVYDGFTYINTADGLIIVDCPEGKDVITVPTQLDGKTVIGISALGKARYDVKELIIPDGIKFVASTLLTGSSNGGYTYGEEYQLETLRIGKDVEYFEASMLQDCYKLKNIIISPNNKEYSDIDGVMFNKVQTILLWYPLARDKSIVLPATIEDFSILESSVYYYGGYYIEFDDENQNYFTEDGVTYNKDKTLIISCDRNKSGSYVMPDSVVSIRQSAFAGCKNLTGVTVSKNVTSISYSAFADCTSLKNVVLPDSVTAISYGAFCDCTSLESIDLPANAYTIDSFAFANATSLNKITFPTCEFVLYDNCFQNTGFTEITVPARASIWSSAFIDCKKLKKATFEEGVEGVPSGIFEYCTALDTVNMASTIMTVEGYAFNGCKALKNISLPSGLREIYSRAFSNSGLVSLTIVDSVDWIHESAFNECHDLKEVNIGKGLEDLPRNIFSMCGLESIVIPENISYIDILAFDGCSKLSSVDIKNPNITISAGAFRGCPVTGLDVEEYKSISPESYVHSTAEKFVIPENVTGIMYGAFTDSRNLLNIEMPLNIEHIDYGAFDGTAWFNAQPDGVLYMGEDDYILYSYKGNAPKGTCIKVKDGTKVMAEQAFCNNYDTKKTGKIKEVVLPESLTYIPDEAFENCSNMESIVIGKDVEHIGGYAFYGCRSLKDVYYSGTEEDWEILYENSNYGNDDLFNAEIHCINRVEITQGDGSVFNPDSEETVTFRSTAEYEDFENVEVDGEVVAPENYDVTKGSTIVIFKNSYLKTLSPGEHIVSIVSSTGVAYAGLEVKGGYTVTGNIESFGDKNGSVTLNLISGGTVINTVTTATGTYMFEEVEDGEYTISASKDKHIVCDYLVTVNGQDAEKNITVFLLGDVNCDGEVDVKDATQITRYSNGKSSIFGSTEDTEFETARLKAGNVNGDSDVDVKDATQITRYSNGKSSIFDTL